MRYSSTFFIRVNIIIRNGKIAFTLNNKYTNSNVKRIIYDRNYKFIIEKYTW